MKTAFLVYIILYLHYSLSLGYINHPSSSSQRSSRFPSSTLFAFPTLPFVRIPQYVVPPTLNTDEESDTYTLMGNNVKPPRKVWSARFVSWILKRIVEARTTYATGLDIQVKAESNRHLLSGFVETVEMKFDSIAYGQLYVTGGGTLVIEGLELRMKSFLFDDLNSLRKPYTIHGDFQLTQDDIVQSKFIKGLIQLLMNTILERALTQAAGSLLAINIQRVTIRDRRINVFGETNIPSTGTRVPFEVSSGAGVRDNGQVVYLRDIQVVLNPNSYLQSPPIPILLNSDVTVDLGDDCTVQSLLITNKKIWIKLSSVISPVAPFAVASIESKGVYRYDLAALLSSILRMPSGIFRRLVNL